ncbi:hypothetical protein BN903_63 [Halorubrum sp. AJ67]|nr:hypothetical protein BN903_63 [Halorubrum sp. AJ67]
MSDTDVSLAARAFGPSAGEHAGEIIAGRPDSLSGRGNSRRPPAALGARWAGDAYVAVGYQPVQA